MPQFMYRGRDKQGNLRVGSRLATSVDALNNDLVKEGIIPIHIVLQEEKVSLLDKIRDLLQGKRLHLEELAIFSRQMQLLQKAGVPIVTGLRQVSLYTRSVRLKLALEGVIEHLEMGQDLATAMQYFPQSFPQLMINIVQIGERSGRLAESFGNLYKYLEFEASNIKQFKAAFRYPIFVSLAIVATIVILNLFVIPTFAGFYTNLQVPLPWQTRILIGMSNLFVHYGFFLLLGVIILVVLFYRYYHSPKGNYKVHQLQLKIPVVGNLLRRIILIRFSQSLAIVLNSGISVIQGLTMIKSLLNNSYINEQISQMQELIERGTNFTQAVSKIELLSPLELQILAVGEKNGELAPALTYISELHGREIEYDIKRLSDLIGPIMITAVSILILIIALGVYLPIWNMINLVH